MEINWRAVLYGFAVVVVLGLLSNATIPFTNTALPVIGWGLTGLVGGLVAGYVVGTTESGAVHGAIATVIGSFVALVILSLLGLFASFMAGVGLFLAGVVALLIYAIPGAVGGAIGGWYHHRRMEPEVTGGAGATPKV